MDYEDLEIEISRCCCGELEVRLLESPVDRPRARLELRDAALARLWEHIDRYEELIAEGELEALAQRRQLAQEIGEDLFRILTPGKVGESLRQALVLLDREREDHDAGIHLRLSFGAPDGLDAGLANLPWELLYDSQGGGRFLGGESPTQIVRYLDLTRKIKPLVVTSPLKVLAVLCSPSTQPQIDLGDQELRLLNAMQQSPNRLELHRLRPPTLEALKGTLEDHADRGAPFHVVHFLGHGELTESGHGALYFEREDRSEQIIPAEVLARTLSSFHDLRLVVLASCSGARLPRQAGRSPFTGCASALIAVNFPAVVAMQFTVTEVAAVAFSSGFYNGLGAGASVVEAVAEGRSRINTESPDSTEWATPVLFLRPADGRVFEVRGGQEDDFEKEKTPSTSVAVRTGKIQAKKDFVVGGVVQDAGAPSTPGPVSVEVSAEDHIEVDGDFEVFGSKDS